MDMDDERCIGMRWHGCLLLIDQSVSRLPGGGPKARLPSASRRLGRAALTAGAHKSSFATCPNSTSQSADAAVWRLTGVSHHTEMRLASASA